MTEYRNIATGNIRNFTEEELEKFKGNRLRNNGYVKVEPKQIKELSLAEKLERIKNAESIEELEALMIGENRMTIARAYDKQLKKLE